MIILKLPLGFRAKFLYYNFQGVQKYIPIGYPFLKNPVYRDQLLHSGIKNIADMVAEEDKAFEAKKKEVGKKLAAFKFKTTPFPNQLESLFNILIYEKFGLFDDMGTGKTKTYLDLAAIAGGRFLIITEAHLIPNIVEVEAKRHRPDLKIIGYRATLSKKRVAELWRKVREEGYSLVLNYENINKFSKELEGIQWTGLVLDESANVKNMELDRTNTVVRIADYCKYVVPATGTPSLGKSMDVYSQMRLISKYIFTDDISIFKSKYCKLQQISYTTKTGYIVKGPLAYAGPKNTKILKQKIAFFYIRHIKNPADYPERTEQVITLEPTTQQFTKYSEFKQGTLPDVYCYQDYPALRQAKSTEIANGHLTLPSNKSKESCDALQCRLPECYGFFNAANCRHRSSKVRIHAKDTEHFTSVKEAALASLIKESLASNRSMIIFFNHVNDMIPIKRVLSKFKDMPVLHLREQKHKIESLEKFKEEVRGKPGVVTAQISSGIGWTFIEASVVVYYSLAYFGDYAQSRDRVYRKGQNRTVHVYILLTSIPEEQHLYQCVINGKNFLEEIMTIDK